MRCCVYTANHGSIVNYSVNPYIDMTYLQDSKKIESLEVLTPEIDISLADYVVRNMMDERNHRGIGIKDIYTYGHSVRLFKKPRTVDRGCCLPDKRAVDDLYGILKGRILNLSMINHEIKNMDLFIPEVENCLQLLYLRGDIKMVPSLIIEGRDNCFSCGICKSSFKVKDDSIICPECGSMLDSQTPVFYSPGGGGYEGRIPVKFKDSRGLNIYEDRASNGLCSFLEDSQNECLLWMAPGSRNLNITLMALRDVLDSHGRCAIVVCDSGEAYDASRVIKDAFPHVSCEGGGTLNDIQICLLDEISTYYKAFDMIICWGKPGNRKGYSGMQHIGTIKALKDGGKVVYCETTPDYRLFMRAGSGNIKLVSVPLGRYGRPTPEPRILTYRIFAGDNLFIPGEVVDFILWSIINEMKVQIIVPLFTQIKLLEEELMKNRKIKKEWVYGNNREIIITTSSSKHIYNDGKQNIIVFFADDRSVFDERELIDAAGMAGMSEDNIQGQVIFVGSRESEEMYNSRLMIRFLNKLAWEMGYLKQ